MKAFVMADMAEVTRLTQEGRLAEAMALLQGRPTTQDETRTERRQPPAVNQGNVIDLAAPARDGEAWTVAPSRTGRSGPGNPAAAGDKRQGPVRRAKLGSTMNRFGLGAEVTSARPMAPPARGARFEERTFVGDAGTLAYKLYTPSRYAGEAMPLVVMLHGCTQSPDDFAAGTGMNALAEAEGFLVAYPAQSSRANASRCWNWFEAAHQARDRGEPALVAGMTREILRDLAVDPARVYVAGLSAGGAAAAVLAAAYPDLFAAAGVHSGLACGAARDMPSAFAAMKGGGGPVRRAARCVPTIVFHGDADRTVHVRNGDAVIAQALPASSLHGETTRGRSEGGIAYTRTVRRDADGKPVLEQWLLHGAGHAWAGGDARGTYTDPRGPDASAAMLAFFRHHALDRAAAATGAA